MNLKRLILFGGVSTLLIAALAGGLLLSSGDSGDDTATADRAPRLGPGFVWIDGEWLSPSFIVETDASVIRINGRLVRRVTRLESDTEAVNNQPEGSLGELLEAAALRFDEMGGTSSEPPTEDRLAELTEYVESLPGATAVSFAEPVLSITDETGQSGYVILQRPDPLTERQNIRSLQAVTTRWTASLRRGDALLFSGDVTLEIPANQAVEFLNALVAVFDLPEGEQQQAMLDLIGEEQMTTEMLAAGRPPAALTDRLAVLTPPEPSLVTLTRDGGESASNQDAEGQYRTPASNKAYIFQPIEVEGPDWCFPDPLIQAALLHGYQVIHLRGKASTLDAAVASSERAGIFYVCGHWHAMEPMATRADAMVKVAAYREALGLTGEDVYPIVSVHTRTVDRMPVPQYYIGAGIGFYEKLWRSADSIVFLSQCHSADLASGFDVREFMAIDGQCFGVETERALETTFFAQLDGTSDDGSNRTVGAAFDAILPGTGWILQGSGGGNTVLSPAVVDYAPQTAVPAASPDPIQGQVQFDTPINQTDVALDNIVLVRGCGAIITQRRWIDDSTLEFEFTTGQDPDPDALQDGPMTITIDAAWAASAGDPWLKLDGNQDPPETNHVGPNKDDFVWTLDCTS